MDNNKFRTIKFAFSLIVDQVLAIFATTIVINIVSLFLPDDVSLVLQFVLGIFVFGAICYIDTWGKGAADFGRAKSNQIKTSPFFGFVFGLVGIIPSFLIAFCAFLAETGAVSFYSLLGEDVFTIINRFWQMPLSSLFVFVNETPILNLVAPFFVCIISGIGYFLGYKGIAIKRYILFKNGSK